MNKATIFSIAAAGTLAGIGLLRAVDNQPASTSAPATPPDKGPKACGFQRHHGSGPMGFHGRPMHGAGQMAGGRDQHPFMGMLNLTDDQKAKVKAIMEAQKPKLDAIRDEERKKMEAIMADAQSQIRPILTAEQQKIVDDLQALRQDSSALKKDKSATP